MNEKAQRLERYLADPNVQKMLALIKNTEHADYNTLVGGSKLDNLAWHPNKVVKLNKKLSSSAAGAYQFLSGTWKSLAKELDLNDFSPRSQDIAAIRLLEQNGSLKDVLKGNFASAVKKSSKTWASLPGSPYGQRTVSWKHVSDFLGGLGNGKAAQKEIMNIANDVIANVGNEGFSIGDYQTAQPSNTQMAQPVAPDVNPPVNNALATFLDNVYGGNQFATPQYAQLFEQNPVQPIAPQQAAVEEPVVTQEPVAYAQSNTYEPQMSEETLQAINTLKDLIGHNTQSFDNVLASGQSEPSFASQYSNANVMTPEVPTSSLYGNAGYSPDITASLFASQMGTEADNIRNDAVTKFISGGRESAAPSVVIPPVLAREIRRIVADV